MHLGQPLPGLGTGLAQVWPAPWGSTFIVVVIVTVVVVVVVVNLFILLCMCVAAQTHPSKHAEVRGQLSCHSVTFRDRSLSGLQSAHRPLCLKYYLNTHFFFF